MRAFAQSTSLLCILAAFTAATQPLPAFGEESLASADDSLIRWDGDRHQIVVPGLDSTLTLGALIHLDTRFYVADKLQQENDVLFRRFRTGAKLDMPNQWSARAVLEWAENADPFFTDATLDKKFAHGFSAKLGKFKAPLNFERLVSGTDMYFMERGYPDNLVASRDIGVQLAYNPPKSVIEWQLAIMQGAPDGSSTEQHDDAHHELMGRIYAMPWRESEITQLHGLGIGIATAVGERDGDSGESLLTEGYRTPAQFTFFRYTPESRGDGRFIRLFPQVTYRHKNYAMINEWTLSQQSLNVLGQQARLLHHAWQTSHSYVLTGEYAGLRGGVVPDSTITDGGIGAWEITARVGGMVMDDDAFPLYADPDASARSVIGSGMGLNWYPLNNVRMMLNYEYADFEGGDTGGTDLTDEHAVFARVQFEY